MRVLFLHSRLSGYFVACLSALKATGVEIGIVAKAAAENAPFQLDLSDFRRCFEASEADAFANEFAPDCVVLGGWWNPQYLEIAARFRRAGKIVVMTSDQPWEDSLQQKLKLTIKRTKIRNAANHIWIPGQPQYPVATYLGFGPQEILTGVYSCDFARFEAPIEAKRDSCFLFVGRLEAVKGFDTMLNAYRIYAEETEAPWKLKVVGSGALERRVRSQPGIEHVPFVQPAELPKLLKSAAAFVLPSDYEPWGVAIHEAAAAGLPLLCSDACGAAYHLLQNNVNGLSFRRGSINELALCMASVSAMSETERQGWGEASRQLAQQYKPERWAQTLIEAAERFQCPSL